MEEYKIVVSTQADKMLRSHVRFLSRVSVEASKRLRNRIADAIRSLRIALARYPFFDADFITPNKYRRMFVENWFLILYQIIDDAVYVDYIIDTRQDYKWLV